MDTVLDSADNVQSPINSTAIDPITTSPASMTELKSIIVFTSFPVQRETTPECLSKKAMRQRTRPALRRRFRGAPPGARSMTRAAKAPASDRASRYYGAPHGNLRSFPHDPCFAIVYTTAIVSSDLSFLFSNAPSPSSYGRREGLARCSHRGGPIDRSRCRRKGRRPVRPRIAPTDRLTLRS